MLNTVFVYLALLRASLVSKACSMHACFQARETGICPVREELYAQCFDELIREVTINCAERGLLLLRVRDEMRMTIAAYQVRLREGWGGLQHEQCCAAAGTLHWLQPLRACLVTLELRAWESCAGGSP